MDPQVASLIAGPGIPVTTSRPIPASKAPNYSSAEVEFRAQVQLQLDAWEATGKIEEVPDPVAAQLVVSPLGAVAKDPSDLSKVRPYLDLSRFVNPFVLPLEMSLPGVDDALRMLHPRGLSFMAKIDLKDAFLHCPIRPECRRLFGFQWRGRFLRFSHLIFGLSTAPALFQSITGGLAAYYRSRGIPCIVYLDDFLIVGHSLEECSRNYEFILADLALLGLTASPTKCIPPCKRIRFLGLEIDAASLTVFAPSEKRAAAYELISAFVHRHEGHPLVPRKDLEILVGKLSFLARAIPAGRVYLRRVWDLFRGSNRPQLPADWREHAALRFSSLPPGRPRPHVRASPGLWLDLRWWLQVLPSWSGVSYWPQADLVGVSDASDTGGCSVLAGRATFIQWAPPLHHSNVREMVALVSGLCATAPTLRGRRVLLASDNVSVVSVINSGACSSLPLMEIRRVVAFMEACQGFCLRAVHIPGVRNSLADWGSRAVALSLPPSSLSPLPVELRPFADGLWGRVDLAHFPPRRWSGSELASWVQEALLEIPQVDHLARQLDSLRSFGPDRYPVSAVPPGEHGAEPRGLHSPGDSSCNNIAVAATLGGPSGLQVPAHGAQVRLSSQVQAPQEAYPPPLAVALQHLRADTTQRPVARGPRPCPYPGGLLWSPASRRASRPTQRRHPIQSGQWSGDDQAANPFLQNGPAGQGRSRLVGLPAGPHLPSRRSGLVDQSDTRGDFRQVPIVLAPVTSGSQL